MARFVIDISSPWPAAQALAFAADLRNLRLWDPSVTRADLTLGLPAQLGSQYEVVVATGGLPLLLRYQTTAASDTAVRVVARTPWLRSDDRIAVRHDGKGGCVLTYDAQLDLRGRLQLLDPLLGWSFDRVANRAAAGLKKVLQGPAPASTRYQGQI